ncbi:SNF2-related protein [Marinobacterium sp. BA1]|uniref:Eco57I restriction-modification methylase domain-containing protein n=1 Tax=Marinobacterium sp. BA1 TaxID=3138931 RepID=UPI0032E70BF9
MTERAASDEDKAVLAKYVGWGGLAGAFTKKMDWAQESATLDMMVESGVITKAEWDSFAASTLNAHYTAPEIAQTVWAGVERLGFTGGRVLEPAVGIGHFIGTVPASLKDNTGFTALDIDPVSARIARALYPDADIKVRPFETFNIPDGTFDLVIGNVPFGDFKLHDPKYNKYNLSIHNYFTLRALDAVHPNGICALITSAYTLDGKSTAARKHMAKRGELLGAVRLPQNAFRRMADTTVETDILFFRRYTPEEEARARTELSDGKLPLWVSSPKDTLSNYFEANVEAVIGELDYTKTQYGGYREVAKLADMEKLLPRLNERVSALPIGVYQPWQHDDQSLDEKVRHVETVPSLELRKYRPGGFALDDNQVPCIIETVERDEESGEYEVTMVPVDLSDAQAVKLRSMILLRDQALLVLQEQSRNESDTQRYLDARDNLNRRYDAFIAQHGALNAPGNRRLFSQDPQSGLLLALEYQDEQTGAFTKARIFSERVLSPVTPPTSADNPRDAMMISMSYYGEISRTVIMRLLDRENTDEHWAEIEDELRQFMFMDPETHRYLPRDIYLSGNVREKLVAAETAAQTDPHLYADNVEALRAIQPRDLTPSDITVQMGAPWIPESDIKDFIYEMLLSDTGQSRSDIDIQYVPLVNSWKIELGAAKNHPSVINRVEKELGTKDVPAHKLIEQSLMSQVPKVMRTIQDEGGERRVVDKDATLAAMAKQQAMEQRFKQWIWESPGRADRLLADYNRRFNCFCAMEPDGSHLTFPGMSPLIELRPHQKNAVWRSLIADNTLFAHEVGTGKTYSMIASLMEMRRLGRAKRPFMVVKRNTLGQIETAARDLYPGADVLVMDAKSMTAKNRRQFLSRVAASDFDIAIMSYEAFASIPLSPDEERLFLMDQRDELEDALSTMTDRSFSRKQMEKAKKRLDSRIASLLDDTKKDDAFYFDDVMPDALCFDESHLLKNLDVNSRFDEFNKQGSKRSMDALSKVRWLTRIHGREMNIIKSSGTPISNSFAESYTLMRYMMNEQMAELMGTGSSVHPDRFFSNFIQRYTTPEIGVDGQYRVRNRYTIVNIPELMGLMNQFMDVRFADDLGIERPDIKRTIVVAKPTEVQEVFKLEIAERAEKIRSGSVDRSDDNFLKLAWDGRKAALDMRLLDPELPDFQGTKLNLMVDEVIERYWRTEDFKGAQAIFCDQGTPGGSGYNLYDDIRQKLIAGGSLVYGGIAPEHIAYAHDAKTDEQREALFAKVNSGEIRVIIGSSEKMGTGTNMQERLCALHHLDAPSNMRPSDVEQREGRIERQGNINSEAEILTYTTEDSFDLFVWNLMNFKRKMVRSIMSNDRSVREYKEDEDGASYEAIMAVTTGNTMIKEKIEIDQKVDMLSAQAREHSAVELRNRREIAEYKDSIPKLEAKLGQLKGLLDVRAEWQSGHQSSMMTVNPRTTSHDKLGSPLPIEETMPLQMSKWTVNGVPVANRDEADMKKYIRSLANAAMSRFTAHYIAPMDIRYAGFPIEWEFNRDTAGDIHETAKVRVEPKGQVEYEARYLYHAVEFIEDLPVNINSLQNRIERSKAALHELETKANTPFEHEAELIELKTRQQFMSDALAEAAEAFQQELRNSSAVTSIAQWKAVNMGAGGKCEPSYDEEEVVSSFDPLAPSSTSEMSIAAARY